VQLALGDDDDDRIIDVDTFGPRWSARLERLEGVVSTFAEDRA
jgi:hypothetical protein